MSAPTYVVPPSPATRRAARAVAHVLDGYRIDPILGLVLPGVGDALSGVVGLGVVALAIRARLPKAVVARMMLNLAIDAVLGAIPLVGDLFDFYFPAHTLNAQLLERASVQPRTTWVDYLVLSAAALLCLAVMALPLVFAFWCAQQLWGHWRG